MLADVNGPTQGTQELHELWLHFGFWVLGSQHIWIRIFSVILFHTFCLFYVQYRDLIVHYISACTEIWFSCLRLLAHTCADFHNFFFSFFLRLCIFPTFWVLCRGYISYVQKGLLIPPKLYPTLRMDVAELCILCWGLKRVRWVSLWEKYTHSTKDKDKGLFAQNIDLNLLCTLHYFQTWPHITETCNSKNGDQLIMIAIMKSLTISTYHIIKYFFWSLLTWLDIEDEYRVISPTWNGVKET